MSKMSVVGITLGNADGYHNARGEDLSPRKILEKVKSTYESMQTLKAEGTSFSDIELDGTPTVRGETSFSILLKKPNFYRISWTRKNTWMSGMDQSGAVWSDGTQPYLYIGVMNAYSKLGG